MITDTAVCAFHQGSPDHMENLCATPGLLSLALENTPSPMKSRPRTPDLQFQEGKYYNILALKSSISTDYLF